jgi:hypothetical protein
MFDTGSSYTWIYNYHELEDCDGCAGGGFGTTALEAIIETPSDGAVMVYADSDAIKCDTWTEKKFELHGIVWKEKFGIASDIKRRSHRPKATGLLGASRNSIFAQTHPVFGFRPLDGNIGQRQTSMSMFYEPIRTDHWCVQSSHISIPLSTHSSQVNHWAVDKRLRLGDSSFDQGVIFDTGSSIIALPISVFQTFESELKKRKIKFDYFPSKLYGISPCDEVQSMPSWFLVNDDKEIEITPDMFTSRLENGQCMVNIASVSGQYPPILGKPFLQHFITEFNRDRQEVSICKPKGLKVSDVNGENTTVIPHSDKAANHQTTRRPKNDKNAPKKDPKLRKSVRIASTGAGILLFCIYVLLW